MIFSERIEAIRRRVEDMKPLWNKMQSVDDLRFLLEEVDRLSSQVEKLRKEVESLHKQLNALECKLIVEAYEKRVYKAEVANLNKSMARKVRQIRDLKEENRKLARRAFEAEKNLLPL